MRRYLFKTKGPLDAEADKAIFVQRKELDDILRPAEQTSVSSYIALLGSRQTGKTTLLYQARSILEQSDCAVAFVDLSVLKNQGEAECYNYVCSQIEEELSARLLPSQGEEESPPVGGPLDFRAFLLDLARRAKTSRIVVMLDEVGAIPPDMSDAFFGTIRNVFSSRGKEIEHDFQKYLFIFSGATDLFLLTSGENSPLNICERVYLSDFDVHGVRQIVANFARLGIGTRQTVADYVYEWTGGHPYLTQRLCSIIEHQRPWALTHATVDRAVAEMLSSDDNLRHIVHQLERFPDAKKLLRDMLVTGKSLGFSRLNPVIAQLEVIGAVSAGPRCRVRNRIYEQALRTYLGAPVKPKPDWKLLKGKAVRFLAALLFLAATPTIFFYIKDIVLFDHYVNESISLPDTDLDVIVRYDAVIKTGEEHTLEVEVEQKGPEVVPVVVELDPRSPDVTSADGQYRLEFDQPRQSKQFVIRLLRRARIGDVLLPFVQDREVELRLRSPVETLFYVARLRVDYLSNFVVSLIVWVGSFVAGVGGVVSQLENLKAVPARVKKVLAGGNGSEG